MTTILLLAAPTASTFGAAVGVVFFLLLAAVAYVAFKAFRKTLRFAVRLVVVAVILAVAAAGGFSLWWFSTGTQTEPPRRQSK